MKRTRDDARVTTSAAAWLATTQARLRDSADELPAVTHIEPLKDSNETNSRMHVKEEEDDDARDRLIAQVVAEHEEEDPVPIMVAPPARAPLGFQPELDDFHGEQDTDDDDDEDEQEVGEAMQVDDETDEQLLDPARHRVRGSRPFGVHGYRRPEVTDYVSGAQDFVFMHVDSSYCIDPVRMTPVMRVWGITDAGHSVLLEDDHFLPYFYVQADPEWRVDEYEWRMHDVEVRLNTHLQQTYGPKQKNGRVPNGRFVVRIERGLGRSLCGYHKGAPLSTFYKITMAHPAHVAVARNSLEYANRAVIARPLKTYEANVLFELRWLIDKHINGSQWIRLPAGTYVALDPALAGVRTGYHLKLKRGCDPQPMDASVKDNVPPLRTLSYDLEGLRRGAGFYKAVEDPVIMVACALHIAGPGGGIVHRVVFATRQYVSSPLGEKKRGTFGPIDDPDDEAEVFVYDTERAMLLAWRAYVVACDPEFLTGWNTDNFDMPALATRAKQCGVYDRFMSFGRLEGKTAWLRESTVTSKAHGSRKTTELLCDGRIAFDALIYVLKMVYKKYRSYTLNAIAKALLNQQKLDIHHSRIPVLYDSDDDDDRTCLAQYCMRDALLPLLLLDKLMATINCVEQARITGALFKWILGGQGRKTFSGILRSKDDVQHTPSRTPKSNGVVTGGGHVEDPIRGYYLTPIASLDFSSLYPSIIIAYNICYSTKVSLAWARANLEPGDYWVPFPSVDKKTDEELERERTQGSGKALNKKERARADAEQAVAGHPTSYVFVKAHIYEGVLPRMLKGLLAARSNVKNMMKLKENEERLFVLDGRQNAIKVVCNSVYGFLKGFILTDYELMASVTSYGRNMLRIVKSTIAEHFSNVRVVDVAQCKLLGLDPEQAPAEGTDDPRPYRTATAFIVYGDTDSTMVAFGERVTNPRVRASGSLARYVGANAMVAADATTMIKPVEITLEDCIRYGQQMGKLCTARFEKPNTLVFEAVKLRALYAAPKCYAALQIEKYIAGERMAQAIARADVAIKGFASKRRDNAKIGSETQATVIDYLLKDANVAAAEQHVRDVIRELMENRVDLSRLVITKGLTKTDDVYAKGGTKQVHVELQKRMRKRARFTGETVAQTGDRIEYIMLAGVAKKSGKGADKPSDLGEDPRFVQRKGAPIDKDYYLNKQIWSTVARIMTVVYEPERCSDIESDMSQKQRETLQVYHRLFSKSSSHMNHMVQAKSKGYAISAFTVALPQCIGCGVRVKRGAVCGHCDGAAIRARKQAEYERLVEVRDATRDACIKCQKGNEHNIAACAAVTCDNYYKRDRAVIDVTDIEDLMKKLK